MCTKYSFKCKTKFQQTLYISFEGVPEMQIGLWHQNADVQFDLFGRSALRFEVLRAQGRSGRRGPLLSSNILYPRIQALCIPTWKPSKNRSDKCQPWIMIWATCTYYLLPRAHLVYKCRPQNNSLIYYILAETISLKKTCVYYTSPYFTKPI